MGVPAFFRWLSRKYSSIVIHCNEEREKQIDGVKIPVDTSQPNPNGIEFDNLYLDMNGIIHPCSHPEDRPAPKNEQEIMIAIFDSIDRLFGIVRPRRLLYMAIDGVAPRAKMNQQRSRRFRASKEGAEQSDLKASLRAELLRNGAKLPEVDPKAERFDSNCITPGTEFMFRLAACLRFYIIDRLNTDPGWRNIEVILSDANVPGEGEHKIMDFIRRQRGQPHHDPNTHHCICGADADLIMLGLATHEPNFTIIREEFKPNQPRPCGLCSQYGHEMEDCCGLARDKTDEMNVVQSEPPNAGPSYIFIRICVIREYIKLEMEMPGLPFAYDFENIIDDWVMMCFFVGNDFLPHLPSLEIREGAIDKLVRLYKDIVHQTGGYLTSNGQINLGRVEKIMVGIGKMEDAIFRKRRESDVSYRAREKSKKQRTKQNQVRFKFKKGWLITLDDDEPEDDVRLWEDGWERYFRAKFNVSMKDFDFRRKLVRSYVEGLCWVLLYYYQGCASWKWFFPFHYAPFASDFFDILNLPTDFPTNTEAKRPLEQLMCVFPEASGQFLPTSWRKLMGDPNSAIIDFYPDDFKIDLNGKKYAWQGVALLPFVDEDRMMSTLSTVYKDLTVQEVKRNSRGDDYLFVGPHHPLHSLQLPSPPCYAEAADIDPQLSNGMAGKIWNDSLCKADNKMVVAPVPIQNCLDSIMNNQVLSMAFKDPAYPEGHIFKAKLLPGAKFPPPTVKPQDLRSNDRGYRGNRGGNHWQPRIGFNQPRSRGGLDQSGHRHIRHHIPNRPPHHSARGYHQQGYQNRPPYQQHRSDEYNRGPRFQSNRGGHRGNPRFNQHGGRGGYYPNMGNNGYSRYGSY
uniref:5'-3' exoribonuclease n=1 Tax=Ciona savignyi TaxID=51511 RepID=H2ZND9_CIOSA